MLVATSGSATASIAATATGRKGKPWGKVDYLLVARYPLPPDDIVDEIEKRYPGLRTNSVPGISVVHSNAHYVLLRVAPRKPGTTPSRFDKAFDGAIPQGLTPRL